MKSTFLPWNRQGWWFEVMSDVFTQYGVEHRADVYIQEYREMYI